MILYDTIAQRSFTLSNYIYVFKENDLMKPIFLSVARTVIGAGAGVICTAMNATVAMTGVHRGNTILSQIVKSLAPSTLAASCNAIGSRSSSYIRSCRSILWAA